VLVGLTKILPSIFYNMAANIPEWKVSGDWFDVCKCSIPCPCEFAQAPTYGDCDAILAYHIKNGYYGRTVLDGLNVLFLSYFKGKLRVDSMFC